MNKDEALVELCKSMLQDSEVTEQDGWVKIVLVGEVGDGHAGMRGYSYNSESKCLLVAPDAHRLEKLKQLHAVMKAENPSGRGWLKCMIRISSTGDVGADFEYNDPERWSHTPENYKERIAEYAAMPV
ncbi:hypothetical protein EII20_14240 [Comamonadaceae bacterium OH2545_COT-014]|nr:hypothetical protein EII20_14240 [Comamonadaceae bacterium OH2545_COT-014]